MSGVVEEWRDVVGWEGWYQVSNLGRVRSVDRYIDMQNGASRFCRGVIRVQQINNEGRYKVDLKGRGIRAPRFVHHLVLEAFVGSRPDGMEGCHNNGNPLDNRLCNLRWDTHVANEADKMLHGAHEKRNRTHCPRKHELAEWNCPAAAKRRGHRGCLACHRASATYRVSDSRFDGEADRQYRRIKESLCA